jgi:hypothetical protein
MPGNVLLANTAVFSPMIYSTNAQKMSHIPVRAPVLFSSCAIVIGTTWMTPGPLGDRLIWDTDGALHAHSSPTRLRSVFMRASNTPFTPYQPTPNAVFLLEERAARRGHLSQSGALHVDKLEVRLNGRGSTTLDHSG